MRKVLKRTKVIDETYSVWDCDACGVVYYSSDENKDQATKLYRAPSRGGRLWQVGNIDRRAQDWLLCDRCLDRCIETMGLTRHEPG